MQQSKRTAVARVILGPPQSLYFWPSIGLRWPKRKGAAEHCAYVPIVARPQPTVWAGVVGFRRSVIHVGAPHSPRVRYALDRCGRGARVQEPNYGHGALLRTHRDRPCSDRATEQADELASLHAPHEDSSCCPDNEQRIATHSLHRKMATSRAEP